MTVCEAERACAVVMIGGQIDPLCARWIKERIIDAVWMLVEDDSGCRRGWAVDLGHRAGLTIELIPGTRGRVAVTECSVHGDRAEAANAPHSLQRTLECVSRTFVDISLRKDVIGHARIPNIANKADVRVIAVVGSPIEPARGPWVF